MQWNGRWFLLVYYCHWINGEGLTLMGGFISTILQCIVIIHWFLQSLFPYIGWQGTIDCCCSHPCPFCIFFLQNVLNQLLVGSWHKWTPPILNRTKSRLFGPGLLFCSYIFNSFFFRANCSTPLGIKRILFLLQQNRDSLVKVCYLC